MTIELYRLLEAVELLAMNHADDDPMDPDVGEVIACWEAWRSPLRQVVTVDGPSDAQAQAVKQAHGEAMRRLR